MAGEESTVAQVERFENYCLRKRSLEGDIELVLARRDDVAVEAVELAENELKGTKRECAAIEARVERARRLDFDRAEKSRLPSDSRPQFSSNSAEEGGVLQGATDSDRFSVVSDPQQSVADAIIDQMDSPSPSSHSKDDLSEEFLMNLVQRYTDICNERRMLQDEIEDRLERKERMASEKLRCAKLALEATRQKAVELVAALNDASQGDTKVNLPARATGTIGSKPGFSDADSVYASGSGPTLLPPSVTAPDAVQAEKHSIPTPASKQTSLPPPSATLQHPSPALPAMRPTAIGHMSQSTPRITPTTVVPPLATPSFSSPLIPATHQAIYKKYDFMMAAAKVAGAAVSMQRVPWPLLMAHADQYPMQNVTEKHLVDSNVIDFIQGYVQWKGRTLKFEGVWMLADWEWLFSQVPTSKPGGRRYVERVVLILRSLLKN
jgi:hypothetical protein